MKKTFKTMLALMAGAMVFTACSNDDITENIPQQIPSALKPMTFTASMEGEDGATRAAIDGLDINWTDGDMISIFDGSEENNGNQEFTLTDGDGTTSGTFTGTAAEATTYYALYPYVSSSETRVPTRSEAEAAAGSAATRLDAWQSAINKGGLKAKSAQNEMNTSGISAENQAIILAYLKNQSITIMSGPQRNTSNQFENVILPAAQTATAGSADPQAMLMIGESTDATTLEFKNVCAYVKVTPQFDCTRIVLKSNGTESLAGTMTVDYNGGAPTTTVTKGAKTVKLTGDIKANNTYYIAVRPGTLASGFTITFAAADYDYKKSTSKEVTFVRNKVINLGSFATSNLTIAEMTSTATAIIGGVETNVIWSQLWAGGPKFAEYNVGVTDGKAESYGGYYCWGKSIDKDPKGASESGKFTLTDTQDTATNLWGNNWRMPTQAELQALLKNCGVAWTDNYKESGKKGTYKLSRTCKPSAGKTVSYKISKIGSSSMKFGRKYRKYGIFFVTNTARTTNKIWMSKNNIRL